MCNPASLDLSAFLFDLLTDFSTAAFGKEPLITVRTYTCKINNSTAKVFLQGVE